MKPNEPNQDGKSNVCIQEVTDLAILVSVNGRTQEILRRLDALQSLLEELQVQSIQTAGKIYNIGSITNANFEFIIGQTGHKMELPTDLAQHLITDDNRWVQSLRQEFLKQGVSVGAKPGSIFQHYGWLIEAFLQKMGTEAGQERSLRRLAFMAEAYQSTLRYLCYIQLAQVFQRKAYAQSPAIAEFIQLDADAQPRYYYLNLLLLLTGLMPKEQAFMPEINTFVSDLSDTGSDLYGTALFLEKHRNLLLDGALPNDEFPDQLLDEYLTGLVFWLRRLAFLAKYRLVSIKDINLSYRLGTPRNFVHLYGELHGMYTEAFSPTEDYSAHSVEDVYTYNQSVLLFRGNHMSDCLERIHDPGSYISLSPLVVDQSVFAEKSTQTPEVYYYTGQDKDSRQYLFVKYTNELEYEGRPLPSNKRMFVKAQNNHQPRLDELFEHLELILQPYKSRNK